MEYELLDTGVFDDDRYFDVFVEYAKAGPGRHPGADHGGQPGAGRGRAAPPADALVPQRLGVVDRRIQPGGRETEPQADRGSRRARARSRQPIRCWASSSCPAKARCRCSSPRTRRTTSGCSPGRPNASPYVKDGINDCVVQGNQDAVNPDKQGTKVAAHYRLTIAPGQSATVRLRLTGQPLPARLARPEPPHPLRRGVRQDPGRPAAGGGRVLPLGDPAVRLPGRGQRDAPGPRRHALEQAVLLLRRRQLAGRAPLQPAAYRLSQPPGTRSGST